MKNIRMFLSYTFTSEKNIKRNKIVYKKGEKKIIKFDDAEIEQYKFHQYKNPNSIYNIDINKIIVSNKFLLVKKDVKYFIGYKDNKEITLLCIFFLEMSIYKMYV